LAATATTTTTTTTTTGHGDDDAAVSPRRERPLNGRCKLMPIYGAFTFDTESVETTEEKRNFRSVG
jgi:hypothetical protein